jgi:disulfide bond formation protein DsbB/mono/diheme cytochrome c family protein
MYKQTFGDIFERSTLYIALAVAWVAMLGSLYFSEVWGYVPCVLCWYQRILMYPLAGLIAVGLLRNDQHLAYLVLPFSLLGQGIATYHYLLQKTQIFGAPTACRTGVPCTTIEFQWLGFITIPFLAMAGFFIITVMMLLALTAGEPSEDAEGPTPWLSVASIIVVVFISFGVFMQVDRPASTLGQFNWTTPVSGEYTAVPIANPGGQADGAVHSEAHRGAQLYQQSCAGCHGLGAEGVQNLGTSLLTDEVMAQSNDVLLSIIRTGISVDAPGNQTGLAMPPSGGRPDLSDAEIISIIEYLRSLR